MVRVTSWYSKVDRDQTASNAAEILLAYPHHKALAMRYTIALQSPNMDGMPRSDSFDNTTEAKIIGHLDDKQFVAQVDYILNEMMPEVSRNENWAKILKLAYITRGGLQDKAIQERLGYEHSAYYEAKKDALCAFAELWPPFPSELVVLQ